MRKYAFGDPDWRSQRREFLRDFGFLRQQMAVAKRLLMVKLHSHSSQLAVLSSLSNGGLKSQRATCGPRRGRLCKQTQLPEAGHRGGVSIADCGFWIADSGQTCGGTPDLRPAASSPRRSIVQNEPNLAGRPGHRRAKCAKRTQFLAAPGEPWPQGRRTKANRAKQSQFARSFWKRQVLRGKRVMVKYTGIRLPQNKANFRRLAKPPEGPVARNKANSRRAGPWLGQSCKTNPIPGGAGSDGVTGTRDEGESCETKPNLGGLGYVGKGGQRRWGDYAGKWNVQNEANFLVGRGPRRAKCAKRTQFTRACCATSPRCSASGNKAGRRW
jgi:hypothetical protein